MFRHGQLFKLKNKCVTVWSEQILWARPGQPAVGVISLHNRQVNASPWSGASGLHLLCVPWPGVGVGVLCLSGPSLPGIWSSRFSDGDPGILGWSSARVGMTAWDAGFESKRPA